MMKYRRAIFPSGLTSSPFTFFNSLVFLFVQGPLIVQWQNVLSVPPNSANSKGCCSEDGGSVNYFANTDKGISGESS